MFLRSLGQKPGRTKPENASIRSKTTLLTEILIYLPCPGEPSPRRLQGSMESNGPIMDLVMKDVVSSLKTNKSARSDYQLYSLFSLMPRCVFSVSWDHCAQCEQLTGAHRSLKYQKSPTRSDQGPLKGILTALKAFQGSETEMRELLEGIK